MFKGGRQRKPIWTHYKEVQIDGKTMVECIYCKSKQLPKACRMETHHYKCSSNPRVKSSVGNKRPLITEEVSEQPPAKKILQGDLDTHVLRTSDNTKNKIDQNLARFFFACNVPFSVVEHPSFLALLDSLRPGYAPPNRKALAGKLLDQVCAELEDEMKKDLKDQVVTLVEDGWSNIHNEPVIATCLQTDSKTYFLDAVETGALQKTAENCKQLCQQSIQNAEQRFGCVVRNIVTDNAKNMEKMREALHQEDPDLNVYGCSAHWLNLLGADLTPPAVIKHIVEINKYFRNHHRPSAWLKEHSGSVKPQLPGDTRWKSQLHTVDTYLTNRAFMVLITQDHESDIDRSIITKVNDHNLFCQARDLRDQLKPIANALDICQRDNTGLARACDVWLDLLEHPGLQGHKAAVSKRFNKAVQPCHLAAYLLHPTFQGQQLTTGQQQQVMDWLAQRNLKP